MAHMYPPKLPESIRSEPRRAAECLLFDAFERLLDDDYRVFYSVAWLGKGNGGVAKQGEADFCLLHPRMGIVVLEVKGGEIIRDGSTGEWVSIDRKGVSHGIKDPGGQARRSMHALKDKILSLPGWKDRGLILGYAVSFPQCESGDTGLGPDLPREVVICSDDLRWLDKKVAAIFDFWNSSSGGRSALGPASCRRITELLSPTLSLRRTLAVDLREDQAEILSLTEQQVRAFEFLRGQRRAAIRGGAGTGKTMIALKHAQRLAEEGFRTLLTCFNRRLADVLRSAAGNAEGLSVDTFHSLCEERARRAGIELPDYSGGGAPREYFESQLPGAFEEALQKDGTERFDAIVVDEGQDFRKDWLALLELAQADGPEGAFYLFYDDTQGIFHRDFEAPSKLLDVPLDRNLRNSRQIHELAMKFKSGQAFEAGGPEGRPVELIDTSGEQSTVREISKLLHRLIREEKVAPCDIAILSGRSVEHCSLAGAGKIGAFTLTADQTKHPDRVLLESIFRFKGLERAVIILVDLSAAARRDAALPYVGITRAQSHLAIVDSPEFLDELRADATATRGDAKQVVLK